MQDEFKRAMHPPKAYGCGRWRCPHCGPTSEDRRALRKLARHRLKNQDRELIDYYWWDSRLPEYWRDAGGLVCECGDPDCPGP